MLIFIVLALATVSVFAWMFYQYSVQKQETAALSEYELVLNERTQVIYTQAKNWQKPIEIEIDDDRLEGDYAEMAAFILGSMRDSAELRNQYLRDLKAQNWDQFLDISRLAKDQKQDYKETEAMLKAVAHIAVLCLQIILIHNMSNSFQHRFRFFIVLFLVFD